MSQVRAMTRPSLGMGVIPTLHGRLRPIRSLGAYPSDACFDPTRSSWLPYWLDNWTEEQCAFYVPSATADIKAAQAAAAEQIRAEAASSGDDTAEGMSDSEVVAAAAVRQAAAAANPKTCTGFNTYNPTTKVCEFDPSRPSFIALAIGGVAALGLVIFLIKK